VRAPGGLVPALGLLAALLAVGAGLDYGVKIYDEGLIAVGALRVAQRQLPVADFWTLYPPGSYLLLGALFHVLGPQLLWLRALHALFLVAIPGLAHRIAADATGRRCFARLAFAVTLVWVAGFRTTYGYPAVPATALCLGAVALLARGALVPARLAAAGGLLGAAALFRHDLGLYALAACAAGVALTARWGLAGPGPGLPARLAWLAGAAALPLLPGLFPLLRAAGPAALFDQLVAFPLQTYPRFRALPLPLPLVAFWLPAPGQGPAGSFFAGLADLLVYVPLLLAPAALAASLALERRQALAPAPGRAGVLLALLSLACAGPFRVRSLPDVQGWAMTTAALPLAVCSLAGARGLGPRAAPLARAALVAALAAFTLLSLHAWGDLVARRYLGPTLALDAPFARGIHLPGDQSGYRQLVAEIRARTPEGACIHSGLVDHDRAYLNDVLLYFLTARCVPHPYQDLHPGLVDRPAVQEEIARALERAAVPLVVLLDLVSEEPNESSAAQPGPDRLDAWLAQHYELHRDYGAYRLLRRRPARAP